MDEEVVPLGHDVQVVDPDVRNYVYGLVTAVSSLSTFSFAWLLGQFTDTVGYLARRIQWGKCRPIRARR